MVLEIGKTGKDLSAERAGGIVVERSVETFCAKSLEED
jgi:hypothetical protein